MNNRYKQDRSTFLISFFSLVAICILLFIIYKQQHSPPTPPDKEDLKKAIHRGYTRGQIDCKKGIKAIKEINIDGNIFYQDTIHYDMPIVSKSSIYIED